VTHAACPLSPTPHSPAAAMILQDLKRWLCANHFRKLMLIEDFIIKLKLD
jgi:hypothetical protein